MIPFFLYIIKSSICLALFYAAFRILFSKETFFGLNRWILLSGATVCLLLPFVKIEIDSPVFIQMPMQHLEEVLAENHVSSHLILKKSEQPPVVHVPDINLPVRSCFYWLVFVYIIGVLVHLFLLLMSIFSIIKVIRHGEKLKYGEYTLVLIEEPINPFNFGRYIILSKGDYYACSTEILLHEQAHLRFFHSLDLIYMSFVQVFHWFNPTVWLLKRELKEIHEFQADERVLTQGIDATKYQLLLVKKAVGSSSYTLANSFNHSKIKKRITMMLKEKSNRWARLKLVLLIPLIIIVLFAFARSGVNHQLNKLAEDESTAILSGNKQYTSAFFELGVNRYLKALTGTVNLSLEEKAVYLSKNTNCIDLKVTALDDIWHGNRKIALRDLSSYIEKVLKSLHRENKPATIFFTRDIDTSADMLEKVFARVGEVISSDKQTAPAMLLDVSSLYWEKVNAWNPPVSPKPIVSLVFYYDDTIDDARCLYIDNEMSFETIQKKIRELCNDRLTMVSVRAEKNVKMGLISGIKQILHDNVLLRVKYGLL